MNDKKKANIRREFLTTRGEMDVIRPGTVCPLVVSRDDFIATRESFLRDVDDPKTPLRRMYHVDVPSDDDPARYWAGQLVYPATPDHDGASDDYLFRIRDVDVDFDEDTYEVDSIDVAMSPFISKVKANECRSKYGSDVADLVGAR